MKYFDSEGLKMDRDQILLHSRPDIIGEGVFSLGNHQLELTKTNLCICDHHKSHKDCLERLCTHWKSKLDNKHDKSLDNGCKFATFMDIIIGNRRGYHSLDELKDFLLNNIEILKWLDWRHLNCIVQSYNKLSKDENELHIVAVLNSFHFFQKFGNYFTGTVRSNHCSSYSFRGGEFLSAVLPSIIRIVSKDDLLYRVFCSINAWNIISSDSIMHKVAIRISKQRTGRQRSEWKALKKTFMFY